MILHHGPSGLIDELVFVKGQRRKGIGGQLLSAIQRCRELRCCEIEVSTGKENRGAREFYKSFGFEERGITFEMDLAWVTHEAALTAKLSNHTRGR